MFFPAVVVLYYTVEYLNKNVNKTVQNRSWKKKLNKLIGLNIIIFIMVSFLAFVLGRYIIISVSSESSIKNELSLVGKHIFNENIKKDSVVTLKEIGVLEASSKILIFNTKTDSNYKLFLRVVSRDKQEDQYIESISQNNVWFRVLRIEIIDGKTKISNNGLYN